MMMGIGEQLRLTLYGTSHGPHVGAILSGCPSGLVVDQQAIQNAMNQRKPGGKYSSKRSESDQVTFLSGVENGITTGEDIDLRILNQDVRSNDYSFLPDHPRPGHQDMVMHKRDSSADLRGGGASSARLTAPIVAAGALISPLIGKVKFTAQVGAIGQIQADESSIELERWADENCLQMRCNDPIAAAKMVELVEQSRKDLDSIGSRVDLVITGLALGLGEPWFDGIEPALARALMSIPAARAVEFGRGFQVVQMTGSEHNDMWQGSPDAPELTGEKPDGALAGLSTGAPIRASIAFKPPSSIAKVQNTLNLKSGEIEPLQVKGRHDPVIGPRAVAVVEAISKLVILDLALRGGFVLE